MRLNPRETSSDLERARELARRLRDGGPLTGGPPEGVAFVRFGSPRPGGVSPTAAATPSISDSPAPAPAPASLVPPVPDVSESPLDDLLGDGPAAETAGPGASWEDTLDRCLLRAGASGALVVDGAGLIIAIRGDWEGRSAEQVDSLAARLQVAVAESARMDEARGLVSLALSRFWLTGVRAESPEGPLTLGLLAPQPVGIDVAAGLAQEVAALVGGAA